MIDDGVMGYVDVAIHLSIQECHRGEDVLLYGGRHEEVPHHEGKASGHGAAVPSGRFLLLLLGGRYEVRPVPGHHRYPQGWRVPGDVPAPRSRYVPSTAHQSWPTGGHLR